MPLFAYALPPTDSEKVHVIEKALHAKAHHTIVHHGRQASDKKKVPATDARTLLPMNGGSTGAPSTGAGSPLVVQNPTAPGSQTNQQIGPPIILIPDDVPTSSGSKSGQIPQPANQATGPKKKWSTPVGAYFDAGAEDLIGTFTTILLHAGVRYYDDELDVYFRNETLDTVGTNLPFQQVISGASVGVDWKHWFMKDHVFVTVSDGRYLSGPFENQWDFRVGAVGEWGWQSDKMFTDIYTDLFYVDLLKDTIYTGRLRSGPILLKNKTGYVIVYGVGQVIADSQGDEGSENRIEGGFGAGYIFLGHFSLNIDMRAGYAYRGDIKNRTYLNPMIVLSGSF